MQSAAASFRSIAFSSGARSRARGPNSPSPSPWPTERRSDSAGLWENWRDPQSGAWIRTFAIITVPANELVAQIHDRMPLILPRTAYDRWLGIEPDPHDLLVPFPSELMGMWLVSTRVNKPENDDASLLDPAA